MTQSPFHIYAKTREFAEWVYGDNRLLAAYASADIKVFPYQIAAAMFALRSPYLKGVILADEGSLGKTYEALLVASQKWFEGKTRQLLILPGNLVDQWVKKIEEGFTLPYTVWISGDSLPEDEEDALIITTYDYAVRHAEVIAAEPWDMVIFDEADVLSKPENKLTTTLKAAVGGAFKLLLTPTPITKDIMDIYGLIHFIDESVLPDADAFYKRYFRKPENYPELTQWVSQFAFRTLKSQVEEYVNFTRRIPYNPTVELTDKERELYAKVNQFLNISHKISFPDIGQWELSLMLYNSLSSSPQAFCKTIEKAIHRAQGEERVLLQTISKEAEAITITGKMQVLLDTLKATKPTKAIVFTDNITTLHTLRQLLENKGYNVLTTTKPDYAEAFRRKRGHAVLLATDSAAKGLDFEFCPVVINYDLLYNTIEMEQRVARCHRQGQTQDVLVVNLLYKENLDDVRIFELIKKRIDQFGQIFGLSDPIVGNFDLPIEEVLSQIRTEEEIQEAFQKNLATHKPDNEAVVESAETQLFTTFTSKVSNKITLTPNNIEEKIAELNDRMWEMVRDYFAGWEDPKGRWAFEIDNEAKTIKRIDNGPSAQYRHQDDRPPILFFYWTGSRNRSLRPRSMYGIGKHHRRGDRITPASPLMRGMRYGVQSTYEGEIVIDAQIDQCEIAFYEVDVRSNSEIIATFDVLVGRTVSGRWLSDSECREVFRLPVKSWKEKGEKIYYNAHGWYYELCRSDYHLDEGVPREELKQRTRNVEAEEEIERIKLRTIRKKSALEHGLDDIQLDINEAEKELKKADDRREQLKADKQVKVHRNRLRQAQASLETEREKLDSEMENEIAGLAPERYQISTRRHFVVKVTGS